MTAAGGQVTMLTFAPMINSEFCRFLLTHYNVTYVEERHIFGEASVIAYLRSGGVYIPLIQGKGFNVVGPKPLSDHYEPLCAPERRLIPPDQAEQVNRDLARYNDDLAGETAVLGYYYLLPHRDIMIEPFTRGLPEIEAALTRVAYPLLETLFTALLKLSPERAAQALARTRAIFDETDKRVADGRRYLVGDRLTLGDLALATAAGPLLLPTDYGSPMPPLEVMPPELKAIITDLRERPTGKFVNQIYENHRRSG